MAKRHDWIGVVCKDQVFVGVKGGFSQLGHGMKISRQRMSEGDGLIYYLPRVSFNGDLVCQSFTSVGQVASDEVYQSDLDEGFLPYCLELDFELCEEGSILPLIDRLSFSENNKNRGYPFRYLETNEEDFEWLAEDMGLEVDAIKH